MNTWTRIPCCTVIALPGQSFFSHQRTVINIQLALLVLPALYRLGGALDVN
jgi:hypothetical protein